MAAEERFEGIKAVVTGGGSGIGFAVAARIVAEGGEVMLWDIDQRRLDDATAKLGGRTRARRVDVTDPDDVERGDRGGRRRDGPASTRSSARAGIAGPTATLIDYPIGEWKRVFDINVNGLFYCNRFVARSMKARGYGRIVNIASIAGKEGNPNASAYSASKAAVIGLTKSLGKELAKDRRHRQRGRARRRSRRRSSSRSRPSSSPTCAPRSRWSASRTLDEAAVADLLAREPRMLVQHRRGVRPCPADGRRTESGVSFSAQRGRRRRRRRMGCGKQVWSTKVRGDGRAMRPRRTEAGQTPSGAARHLPQHELENGSPRPQICECSA